MTLKHSLIVLLSSIVVDNTEVYEQAAFRFTMANTSTVPVRFRIVHLPPKKGAPTNVAMPVFHVQAAPPPAFEIGKRFSGSPPAPFALGTSPTAPYPIPGAGGAGGVPIPGAENSAAGLLASSPSRGSSYGGALPIPIRTGSAGGSLFAALGAEPTTATGGAAAVGVPLVGHTAAGGAAAAAPVLGQGGGPVRAQHALSPALSALGAGAAAAPAAGTTTRSPAATAATTTSAAAAATAAVGGGGGNGGAGAASGGAASVAGAEPRIARLVHTGPDTNSFFPYVFLFVPSLFACDWSDACMQA
jgi:hypothetical protein